uniref:Uncharacterized protein n=2 Tax=Clytia hemisphaerica TaxID=252671 RepID=A0A7M5VGQ5_9CNID
MASVKEMTILCHLLNDREMVSLCTKNVKELVRKVKTHLEVTKNDTLIIRSPKKRQKKRKSPLNLSNLRSPPKGSRSVPKHPFTGRFGVSAEVTRQWYRAKHILVDEDDVEINVIEDGCVYEVPEFADCAQPPSPCTQPSSPSHFQTSDFMAIKDVKGKKRRLDSSACLYNNDIKQQLSSPVF